MKHKYGTQGPSLRSIVALLVMLGMLLFCLCAEADRADNQTDTDQIEAFVTRCYQLTLDRDAEQDELKDWSEALMSGTTAAANLIDSLFKSDEFKNRKLSNEDKVEILYQAMFCREADAEGKAGWVKAMKRGYSMQRIINGFCTSPEFTAICNDYGISAGTLTIAVKTVKREGITPEGNEAEAPVVNKENSSEFINEGAQIICDDEQCVVVPPGL